MQVQLEAIGEAWLQEEVGASSETEDDRESLRSETIRELPTCTMTIMMASPTSWRLTLSALRLTNNSANRLLRTMQTRSSHAEHQRVLEARFATWKYPHLTLNRLSKGEWRTSIKRQAKAKNNWQKRVLILIVMK